MKRLSLFLFAATLTLAPAMVRADAGDPTTNARRPSDQISVQTTGDVTFDLESDEIYDLHGTGTLTVTEAITAARHTETHAFFASSTQLDYQLNGADHPFDDTAKDWLRGVLAKQPSAPPPPPPPTR